MVDAQGAGGALVEGDLSGRKAHDPQGRTPDTPPSLG